ncbi:MAG TPA: isochorismatase family cysteine hydrolase [Chloroflexota bacterium]|nr:isochorismatase family cysteine hydrolase [Chloroflexota bacterium]
MPALNPDLHGNVPDQSPVALILIDVINDFEYDAGPALLERALPIAERLAALKQRCRDARIPAIYVNDNFGRWRSDQRTIIEHCLRDGVRGESFVRRLLPDDRDYFVLKPKHSGFYSTTLDTLLDYLQVRTVILTGLTGDYCVLFTASDAFLRDFHIVVPSDCVASSDDGENEHALRHMQRVLDADVRPSTEIDFTRLLRGSPRRS